MKFVPATQHYRNVKGPVVQSGDVVVSKPVANVN